MDKIIKLGTVPTYSDGTRRVTAYCRIRIADGELSITGVIGPTRTGNAMGACGQINGTIREHIADGSLNPANGWTLASVADFLDIWDRWHLNQLNAGTPDQQAVLRAAGRPLDYATACETLCLAGMLDAPHDGALYRYGTAWLSERLPAHVVEYLGNVLESETDPHWC